jgi:DNA invertase Pin-like site-specific DNA recombinase
MSDELYFAYSRQSLSRAGDRGDSVSIADQFRMIEQYAERLGGRIVGRFSDSDTSGATESRDGLDRLLADVKTVKPAAVIVRDISRLARDTRIFLTLIDTLQKSNVKLLSATESLEDRTLTVVMSSFAERERLVLAGKVAGGVREHARRGRSFGRPPYGYRRVDGKFVIIESEAAVIRRIYERYAAGDSGPMIAEALNADPLAPPAPRGRLWRADSIVQMLAHRAYCGDVTILAKRDISGRAWPAVETRDAHPAIVPRDLWETANRRLNQASPVVRETPRSPFAGLLVCAHCGQRLYVLEHKRHDHPYRDRPNPPIRRVVRCATYGANISLGDRVAPPCPGRIGSRELKLVEPVCEEAVTALLNRLAAPEAIQARADARRCLVRDDSVEKARERLTEIERRRTRLLDAYESGSLDLMTWQGRDRTLAAEAEQVAAIIAAEPPPLDMARLLALRAGLAALDPTVLDHRAILTELGARVIFDLDAIAARIELVGAAALLFA